MRRTHLWISLVVGLVVWGVYFAHVGLSVRRGDVAGLWLWFLGALGVVVLAEGVVTGLLGWLFRRRSRALDEGPTLQAALQASHVALMLLVGLVLTGAAVLALASLFGWTLPLAGPAGQALAANILLLIVVLAELTRAAFTLALLPRR
jgi:Kef-type K+ transport system membrane component KefB